MYNRNLMYLRMNVSAYGMHEKYFSKIIFLKKLFLLYKFNILLIDHISLSLSQLPLPFLSYFLSTFLFIWSIGSDCNWLIWTRTFVLYRITRGTRHVIYLTRDSPPWSPFVGSSSEHMQQNGVQFSRFFLHRRVDRRCVSNILRDISRTYTSRYSPDELRRRARVTTTTLVYMSDVMRITLRATRDACD